MMNTRNKSLRSKTRQETDRLPNTGLASDVNGQTDFKIRLLSPSLEPQWIAAAAEHFQANLGDPRRSIGKFEDALARFTGSPYVSLVNSGVSALHLALLLLDIKEGDEVFCSTFTFAASAFAIRYVKAEPVFIDSEPVGWNMHPDILKDAIRDRVRRGKRPAAIIVVHALGMPARMQEILEAAQSYQVPVIEDAAGALGSFYNGYHAGSMGTMGIVSFNYNKIVTTGGGGALLLKNKRDYEKALYLSTQAKARLPYYEHHDLGFNFQLNHFAAELGFKQLENIDSLLKRKAQIFDFYRSNLQDHGSVAFIEKQTPATPNHWLNGVLFETPELRDKIAATLMENKIETRYLWKPMHLQPVFKNSLSYRSGVAEQLFERGLSLPSSAAIGSADLEKVVSTIQKALNLPLE